MAPTGYGGCLGGHADWLRSPDECAGSVEPSLERVGFRADAAAGR